MTMHTLLVLSLSFAGAVYAMQQPIPEVDLNQMQDYLETYTGAANLVKAYPSLGHMDPQEQQEMNRVLALLPHQNAYVNVIRVGDMRKRRMCTKKLTEKVADMWADNYNSFHGFDPAREDNNFPFFPEVLDGLTRAANAHGGW